MVQHRSTATVVVGTDLYILDSGALLESPQQGVIVLVHQVGDSCAHPGQQVEEKVYPTSGVHGTVTLTAVQGPVVQFSTADGTTGSFNVVTRQGVSRNPDDAEYSVLCYRTEQNADEMR